MNVPDDNWNTPPERLELNDDGIDVWRARLNTSANTIDRYIDWLSPHEHRRAKRYYFNKHRQSFVVRRILLRKLIGRYLDMNPWDVLLDGNQYGKPMLAGELAKQLQFNLSFSNNMALFAFSRHRSIGVDIENIDDRVIDEYVAQRHFSSNEIATFIALPRKQQVEAFYNCWTRKESWIKARGLGLSIPLDSFEVSLAPGDPARLIATGTDTNQLNNWTMYSLTPAPGYTAAVAAQGTCTTPRQFDISLSTG
jgi:4'-phosphopantetheinyl transferase